MAAPAVAGAATPLRASGPKILRCKASPMDISKIAETAAAQAYAGGLHLLVVLHLRKNGICGGSGPKVSLPSVAVLGPYGVHNARCSSELAVACKSMLPSVLCGCHNVCCYVLS
jgi:hypothetical protein